MFAKKESIITIVDENDNLIAIIRKTERYEVLYSVKKLDQDQILSLLNKLWDDRPIK